jgi:hypothetical protein
MCQDGLSKTIQSTGGSQPLYAASPAMYLTLVFRDLESVVVEKVKTLYDLPLDPSNS